MSKPLTAEQIIKKHYASGSANSTLVKYGKIHKTLAFEITRNSGQYLDGSKYSVVFVEYDEDTGKTTERSDLDIYDEEFSYISNCIEELKLKS